MKNVPDVFCNISLINTEVVTEDSYNFFLLLPLVALYSCIFPRNQVLLTSTNTLDKTDSRRFYSQNVRLSMFDLAGCSNLKQQLERTAKITF